MAGTGGSYKDSDFTPDQLAYVNDLSGKPAGVSDQEYKYQRQLLALGNPAEVTRWKATRGGGNGDLQAAADVFQNWWKATMASEKLKAGQELTKSMASRNATILSSDLQMQEAGKLLKPTILGG